jgi:hypothetical protein
VGWKVVGGGMSLFLGESSYPGSGRGYESHERRAGLLAIDTVQADNSLP